METCDLRIGIATGEALVGSIGSDVMMSYTLMGDVVNLASRLEGANRLYGTRNLVSERTIVAAGTAVEVREIDRVVVAGHTHAEVIFEILGRKAELTPQQLALRESYLEGLAAYRERRWDDAVRALSASLETMPGDGPSMALLSRVETLKTNPPSQDWDASWHLEK
jgi:adenylate cyclase